MQPRLIVRAGPDAMRQVDSFVLTFVKEHGIAADEGTRTLILLEELLTNLIKYGYPDQVEPGHVEINLALKANRLTIEFIDDGRAFDPFAEPIPNLDEPPENRPPGGLGLIILRSLSDETHYERRNQSNVIRLSRMVE
jgi:anti-sigma regulatory factor (Ser/Thr protein kinase)